MKKQSGFTLIELIIVIVILGILAAYAVPKYMSVDKEARVSVVKGLQGSLRAATDVVHALAIAKVATGTVNVGTTNVTIGNGQYPTADAPGITEALADPSGFDITYASDVATFTKSGAADANACKTTYDISDANKPVFSIDTSGC